MKTLSALTRADAEYLAQALEAWAQNEEMIDNRFLPHGETCIEAAAKLRELNEALAIVYDLIAKNRAHV